MELKLHSLQYVVFYEADRLFEMGFSEQLLEIIRRLPEMRYSAVCVYSYRIVSVTALSVMVLALTVLELSFKSQNLS